MDRNSLEWIKPNKLKVIRASRLGGLGALGRPKPRGGWWVGWIWSTHFLFGRWRMVQTQPWNTVVVNKGFFHGEYDYLIIYNRFTSLPSRLGHVNINQTLYYPAVPGFFKSWLIWVNTGGRLEISWWLMQSPCTLCLCSNACLACWLWQNAIWWLPDKQATQCTQNTDFLYCPCNTYTVTYHAWYSWQAKTQLKSPQVSLLVCVMFFLCLLRVSLPTLGISA